MTLAECAFGTGGIGLSVDLPAVDSPASWSGASTLFSESASRVVVSVARENLAAFLARANALAVPAREIGTTGGSRISVSINGRSAIDVAVSEAETIWERHWTSFSSSEPHRTGEQMTTKQKIAATKAEWPKGREVQVRETRMPTSLRKNAASSVSSAIPKPPI